MSETNFARIAIAGIGLIGGSFAAAIKTAYANTVILGIDADEEAGAYALQVGWIDQFAAAGNEAAFHAFVSEGCDLVVLAVPADAAGAYFELLNTWGYAGIITDTSSTKTRICADAAAALDHAERFIPGHPMAGSEVNGIAGARPDLFEGAHWILCPNETTIPEAYTALHEFLTGLGARVVSLPREDHDRAMAIVSHVPHFVAASLVELAARHADQQQSLFRLAAGGFKDSTRIAAGSPSLWCGIALDNREALISGLSEMRDIIGTYLAALEAKDAAALEALLDHSASARRAIPAKWVPATEDLLEVRIPMRNRQGVVAEVTTIASKVGCNIQSIEIDHLTSSSAVLSMVFTDEGDVGKLSTELIKAGFSVSLSPLSVKE